MAVACGQVCLWNLDTGKLVWCQSCVEERQIVHEGRVVSYWNIASVAFSPDGKRVVAAGPGVVGVEGVKRNDKGGMLMLNATTGDKVPGFVGTKVGVASVCFTPNGAILIGASADGVRFWDSQTGKTLFTLD